MRQSVIFRLKRKRWSVRKVNKNDIFSKPLTFVGGFFFKLWIYKSEINSPPANKLPILLFAHFAELSGDFNPIHLDEEFAAKTRFKKRIAHGMISGALISAVLGYEFKERKVVYLSQTMKFIAPVFLDDTVTATATITDIREDKPIVTIETICTNQEGKTVVSGEGKIMVLD